MEEYDFAVIGSGIAGLSFALKAAKHGSVAVITKRKGADTNTAWAQGGIACVTSDEDTFALHVRDTLEAAEVFRGNTQDPQTFGAQGRKASQRFGCQRVTFVGARGRIKTRQRREVGEGRFSSHTP